MFVMFPVLWPMMMPPGMPAGIASRNRCCVSVFQANLYRHVVANCLRSCILHEHADVEQSNTRHRGSREHAHLQIATALRNLQRSTVTSNLGANANDANGNQ